MLNILQRKLTSLVPGILSKISFHSSFIEFTHFPSLSKMSENAIVKYFEGESRFTFSFHLVIPANKINKQFNMNRDLSEETSAFLERLNNNINKANRVKGTKVLAKFENEESTVIEPCDKYKTVQDFLFSENLRLLIETQEFRVVVNPPLVRELKISENILTELLLWPYSLVLDFADESKTKIEWFVSERLNEDKIPQPQKKAKIDYSKMNLSWTKFGEGFSVTPSSQNVHCLIKLEVTPFNKSGIEGEKKSLLIGQPVTAGPGLTPAITR